MLDFKFWIFRFASRVWHLKMQILKSKKIACFHESRFRLDLEIWHAGTRISKLKRLLTNVLLDFTSHSLTKMLFVLSWILEVVCFSVFSIFMLEMVQILCWFLNWFVGRVFQECAFQHRMSQLDMSGILQIQHSKRSWMWVQIIVVWHAMLNFLVTTVNVRYLMFEVSEIRHSVFF